MRRIATVTVIRRPVQVLSQGTTVCVPVDDGCCAPGGPEAQGVDCCRGGTSAMVTVAFIGPFAAGCGTLTVSGTLTKDGTAWTGSVYGTLVTGVATLSCTDLTWSVLLDVPSLPGGGALSFGPLALTLDANPLSPTFGKLIGSASSTLACSPSTISVAVDYPCLPV